MTFTYVGCNTWSTHTAFFSLCSVFFFSLSHLHRLAICIFSFCILNHFVTVPPHDAPATKMVLTHYRIWKRHLLYHMSDQDRLHLGRTEVTQDVRSKQRSHLKKQSHRHKNMNIINIKIHLLHIFTFEFPYFSTHSLFQGTWIQCLMLWKYDMLLIEAGYSCPLTISCHHTDSPHDIWGDMFTFPSAVCDVWWARCGFLMNCPPTLWLAPVTDRWQTNLLPVIWRAVQDAETESLTIIIKITLATREHISIRQTESNTKLELSQKITVITSNYNTTYFILKSLLMSEIAF